MKLQSLERRNPFSNGPGAHAHEENEELFDVLEGVMTLLAGDDYRDAREMA
ncbi:RmlC-like protein [Paenibacillus sp. 32O-W]|uniref:hypothetical protein n=1 Tax=Paenibacillus sp. 32O-W TaxID=1695218 RepID=UPI0007210680|nr:hypothetical protein [Paenibacillus sp. 32O-W]ALS29588.1 RmlC-like protein [Paenibacillus sp. 32O-W]